VKTGFKICFEWVNLYRYDEALLRLNRVYVNEEEESEEADVVVMEELLRQRVHLENERRAISKTAKLAAKVGWELDRFIMGSCCLSSAFDPYPERRLFEIAQSWFQVTQDCVNPLTLEPLKCV
jgi:hypothetical protein